MTNETSKLLKECQVLSKEEAADLMKVLAAQHSIDPREVFMRDELITSLAHGEAFENHWKLDDDSKADRFYLYNKLADADTPLKMDKQIKYARSVDGSFDNKTRSAKTLRYLKERGDLLCGTGDLAGMLLQATRAVLKEEKERGQS